MRANGTGRYRSVMSDHAGVPATELGAFRAASEAVERGWLEVLTAQDAFEATLPDGGPTWDPLKPLSPESQRALEAQIKVHDEQIERQITMLAALDALRERAATAGGLESSTESELGPTRSQLVDRIEISRHEKRALELYRRQGSR